MSVKFIAIGTSLGGVKALSTLFAGLPADFSVPIAVVIHRAPTVYDYLIESLQKSTVLNIEEASDKLPVTAGRIVVAPADYHLLVDEQHYALSLDAPVDYARPSINVLFESVAEQYGASALGILLTGGGNDGVQGMQRIKQCNGSVLIESPDSAQDPTLPLAAIHAGVASTGYSLDQIIGELTQR
ncbi:MAG: chemotaxis protein CheB [Granulosicoccus sp.]